MFNKRPYRESVLDLYLVKENEEQINEESKESTWRVKQRRRLCRQMFTRSLAFREFYNHFNGRD